ncbi:FAD-dependent oxidoreductase [Sphaerisporangium corydalis]|uniref:FAD-dependent oxidoreductase n=1 Tax=Sphaerisporangium corydalis TaxID=1441875 RepID=A0ABV9E9U1_9ACTN|nr:NAD(P)/FAD-dependent oxidoreductase [Sphaerisporangium corydalis]
MRVLVIGAGIGGLCLAQGLRKEDVEVEVYERARTPADSPSGFGIHVNTDGCRALSRCLPPEAWARFDAVAVPARATVRFSDERLRPLGEREIDRSPSPDLRRRAVSRSALRDALLHGLDDGVVRWGKEFTGYDQTDDGRVVAHFADGGHATGDLLVGADGSNSRVRRRRLPDLERLDVGVLNIAGRHPLTEQSALGLPATLIDGSVNNIVPPGPGWMFASAWRTTGEGADRGSVVWAYAAARHTYPPDVLDLDGHGLRDLVLDRIEGWAPALRGLVAGSDLGTLAPVELRSMPVLKPWPSGTVTLLGDAIHNMTPMAGIGANTALRDADALRRALVQAGPGRHALVGAVAGYEQEMRAYANQALALSLRNARNAGSDARLPRHAFRAMLRLTRGVATIKRAMS